MKKIDLHVHSNYSDGTLTPQELIREAKKQKVEILSLVDHDNYKGIEEITEHGKNEGIEVIPGIEISATVGVQEFHILGYYIDYKNEEWNTFIEESQKNRLNQLSQMCQKLNTMGYNISWERVLAISEGKTLGTYLLGICLMEAGYAQDVEDATQKLLGKNKPAFIPRKNILPVDAVKLILKCQGIPVLAHSFISHNTNYIHELKENGLKGIEAYYPRHTEEQIGILKEIAKKEQLIVTGGTDYHGPFGPHCDEGIELGSQFVPETVLTELQKLR